MVSKPEPLNQGHGCTVDDYVDLQVAQSPSLEDLVQRFERHLEENGMDAPGSYKVHPTEHGYTFKAIYD